MTLPWVDTYVFVEPMRDVRGSERAAALGRELERELPQGHPLAGREWRVVAEALPQDDVVAVSGDEVVLVHLTHTAETDPRWPAWHPCLTSRAFEELIEFRY